jgi:hypothetical protein
MPTEVRLALDVCVPSENASCLGPQGRTGATGRVLAADDAAVVGRAALVLGAADAAVEFGADSGENVAAAVTADVGALVRVSGALVCAAAALWPPQPALSPRVTASSGTPSRPCGRG